MSPKVLIYGRSSCALQKPVFIGDTKEYRLPRGTVIFDKDFKLPKGTITITDHGYARIGNTYLHRVVANTPKGYETDHINHDKLDNREVNLRVCIAKQHAGNRLKTSTNRSGYLGVHFAKIAGKWCAQVQHQRKTKHLGYFDTPKEAALARDKYAKEVFGEFANLNFN